MSWHVPDAQLERFAAGPGLPTPTQWSIDAHLERCPDCRARLATVVPAEIGALVDEVQASLAELPLAPQRRRRFAPRVTGGLLVSRLAACLALLLAATLLDLAAADAASPSWVLLVAPVLPLVGVAASWSRALDPAHDLVAGTPAAGLPLLLRRTLAVLVVVVPAALLAGLVTGEGDRAAWLLPCLGLTAAALALGGVMDLARATWLVAAAWALGVAAPALALDETPALLEPAWAPAWAALAVFAAAAVALRRHAYRRGARA
jgi:Putative zinc-finger